MFRPMRIAAIHKYASLILLAFWLTQVASGLIIAFRWELDDAILGGDPKSFDLDALSQRLQEFQAGGEYTVHSVWASGGLNDRFDVFLEKAGVGDMAIRLDGQGNILRERGPEHVFSRGGLYNVATNVHATLYSGDIGHWIIGLSGLFLATNIALGLKMAWPKRGRARRVLLTRPTGSAPARLLGWHRKAGLWFALPGFGLVILGAVLALSEPLQDVLGWGPPLPSTPVGLPADFRIENPPISPAQAIRTAFDLHPGSELSGFYLPDTEEPWYTIRLLRPDEPSQTYGRTAVLVNAANGSVLADQAATTYSTARRWINSLYPLHTGQIAGLPGRFLSVLCGLWLLAMMALGLSLYWKRRST